MPTQITLDDTLRFVDVGNSLLNPSFLLSIAATIIAIAAIIVPQLIIRNTKRNEAESIKSYILSMSKTLSLSYERRIIQFGKLVAQFDDINSRGFEYAVESGWVARNILSINHERAYHVFVSSDQKDGEVDFTQFKELYDSITFFAYHDEIAKDNFSKFLVDLKRHEDNYSNNMNAILRSYDRFKSHAESIGMVPAPRSIFERI